MECRNLAWPPVDRARQHCDGHQGQAGRAPLTGLDFVSEKWFVFGDWRNFQSHCLFYGPLPSEASDAPFSASSHVSSSRISLKPYGTSYLAAMKAKRRGPLHAFLVETGGFSMFVGRFFRNAFHRRFEWREFVRQCVLNGNGSLPLVAVTAFIMGLVLTVQS